MRRQAVGEVVARATVQLDALVLLARDDPDAVVFYLVPPLVARGALGAAVGNQATQEALALREDTANSPNAMGMGQWQQNQALVLSRAQDAGQR
jgi:hypothetical protein